MKSRMIDLPIIYLSIWEKYESINIKPITHLEDSFLIIIPVKPFIVEFYNFPGLNFVVPELAFKVHFVGSVQPVGYILTFPVKLFLFIQTGLKVSVHLESTSL